MKGHCSNVICQICNKEMSFGGRIKNHIKSRHNEITLEQYLILYYKTLPLHNPCAICKEKIVYKYQTCSKQCHSILSSSKIKGKPKPKGFMNQEHKDKISNYMMGKPGRFAGHKHSEKVIQDIKLRILGKKFHLGFKHTNEYKLKMSKIQKGNQYRKGIKMSPESIEKIFKHRKINKLEQIVFDLLKQNNIDFKFQFFINNGKGLCKSYDFKIDNILLEIDGDYWHGHPNVVKPFFKVNEVRENDKIKDKLALDKGYKLIRIWESDIKNDINVVLNRLKLVNVNI